MIKIQETIEQDQIKSIYISMTNAGKKKSTMQNDCWEPVTGQGN